MAPDRHPLWLPLHSAAAAKPQPQENSRFRVWKKRHDLGNSLFVEVAAGRNAARTECLSSKPSDEQACLPIEGSHSRHHIEVSIPAQQWKAVLAAQGRNPKVIRWNRLSSLPQFDAHGCIMMRSLFVNVEHSAVSHETIQPPPIPNPIAGLCDPEPIFPNYHDWKR